MAAMLMLLLSVVQVSATETNDFVIKGSVSMKGKEKAIAGAEIFIVELNKFVKTDNWGHFRIRGLSPGTYTLTIFSEGVKTHTEAVTITDRSVDLDFELEMLSQDLEEVVIESSKDNDFGITRLKAIEGTAIYASKKNEVIRMEDADANLATNNSREVYSKSAESQHLGER